MKMIILSKKRSSLDGSKQTSATLDIAVHHAGKSGDQRGASPRGYAGCGYKIRGGQRSAPT